MIRKPAFLVTIGCLIAFLALIVFISSRNGHSESIVDSLDERVPATNVRKGTIQSPDDKIVDSLSGEENIVRRSTTESKLNELKKLKMRLLKENIESEDPERWHIGMFQLLEDDVSREDAIDIANRYLIGSNNDKRLYASDILLRLGYKDGIAKVLVELALTNPEAMIDASEDRIPSKALRRIRQYRLVESLSQIRDALKDHSKRYKLHRALAELGDENILPDIDERAKRRVFQNHIEYFGLLNAKEQSGFVKEKFEDTNSKVGMKTASAWAMLRFGYDEPYRGYLKETAQEAIDVVSQRDLPNDYFEKKKALIYLASIESEDTKVFLEKALDSENRDVVNVALTNLLLRYESSKAKQKLIEALGDRQSIVDMELKYRLATVVNDPEVNAAHPLPERGTNTTIAWRYRVHQKDWSIYNWVHDYTIDYWYNKGS